MLAVNRENLKNSHQVIWFLLDFLMLALLFVSLGLLIFDSTWRAINFWTATKL